MKDEVILVTEDDVEVGHCEKLKAHIDGKLHRAFSLMIAKKTVDGYEFLLQKRASGKYHSGGKWSNSCCSHPRPGEALESAVSASCWRGARYQQAIKTQLSRVIHLSSTTRKQPYRA
ncbi:hypothetical protein ACFSF3_08320 [Vibrio chagasii]